MPLLTLSDVSISLGGVSIIENLSLNINQGERWGVVGRNGAGKTTFFRLLVGDLDPSSGTLTRTPNLRVTMLDQHREFDRTATVWEAAASGFEDVLALGKEVDRLTEWLEDLGENATEADALLFTKALERFSQKDGYAFHARVDAVLNGLGFDPIDARTRSVGTLSGGELGRVGLAAQLAAPADIRLFDEPTNHLDLDTTRWLTQYLRESGETVMVISHDRAFLDETVDRVLHVFAGSGSTYKGGYSEFVGQRNEKEISELRAVQKQKSLIKKEEDFIRRHIAGQKTKQAQSRRRKLERMPRLSKPPSEEEAMALRLESGARGGDRVIEAQDLSVGIGALTLIRDVSVTAIRGDVIALVGANGTGKSSLLATILGELPPLRGKITLGASISASWYRQDLAGVPLDRKIFDIINDLKPLWTRGQVQNHLGAFRFSGDEVSRKTNSLSGGERSRVALAMITLASANLLVLDEPTNHLDVEGIEVLEDAIERYGGTVILVSHDRAFLRELATRVWVIRNEKLEDFGGPFVDWELRERERMLEEAARDAEELTEQKPKPKQRPVKPPDPKKILRKKREELESAELRVEEAEATVKNFETALTDDSLYDGSPDGSRRAAELGQSLEQARITLEEAMNVWASAVEALEQLEAE